jgi:hypothetical protein
MILLRDWHGVMRARLQRPIVLDRDGVRAAWGELDDPYATIARGVRQAPCRAIARHHSDWSSVFEAAVSGLAGDVLALGGGVDGAAVLVAWRASGRPLPRCVTWRIGSADYDEVEVALQIASQLGARCDAIDLDLVALAPEAAVLAQAPVYNLHTDARLGLFRAAGPLITGDGADAVFRGAPDLDYVPLVAALGTASSPFFAEELIAATPIDADKTVLREYLCAHGLGWLASRAKQPRLAPALDLAPIANRERIAQLADELALPPRLDIGWVTLDFLARDLC